jgi:hypothetical protein
MIVIGADTHKGSHALAAVDEGTGKVRGHREIKADDAGHLAAVRWARGLDEPRERIPAGRRGVALGRSASRLADIGLGFEVIATFPPPQGPDNVRIGRGRNPGDRRPRHRSNFPCVGSTPRQDFCRKRLTHAVCGAQRFMLISSPRQAWGPPHARRRS